MLPVARRERESAGDDADGVLLVNDIGIASITLGPEGGSILLGVSADGFDAAFAETAHRLGARGVLPKGTVEPGDEGNALGEAVSNCLRGPCTSLSE